MADARVLDIEDVKYLLEQGKDADRALSTYTCTPEAYEWLKERRAEVVAAVKALDKVLEEIDPPS